MFINSTYCRCHKNSIPKTKYQVAQIFTYKTVKLLFGYSTGRLVSYLSPAYGGSSVTINIPTYFKEKKMAEKREQRDRNTSSKLVHIEQVIGLAKTF